MSTCTKLKEVLVSLPHTYLSYVSQKEKEREKKAKEVGRKGGSRQVMREDKEKDRSNDFKDFRKIGSVQSSH